MEILYNIIDCTSPEGIIIKKMADKLSLAYGQEKKLREAQIEIFKGFAFLLIEDSLYMAESKDLKAVKQLEELREKSQKKTYFIHHCVNLRDALSDVLNTTWDTNKNVARRYVGSVEAYSLNGAFAAAQNHNREWEKLGERSTSVGDIIQDEDGFHLVCNIGFETLLFT